MRTSKNYLQQSGADQRSMVALPCLDNFHRVRISLRSGTHQMVQHWTFGPCCYKHTVPLLEAGASRLDHQPAVVELNLALSFSLVIIRSR